MISLCITSYNRDQMTVDSFAQVLNDERISEIVIVDDHSDETIYNNLAWMVNGIEKVKLFRNPKNLGCYHNKRMAVECAGNEWIILFDSDNVIGIDYLDSLFNPKLDGDYYEDWTIKQIYQPEFAKPHFDFTRFSGSTIQAPYVKNYMIQKGFDTMLNAMNFFVNRAEYLRVFDTTKEEPWTADSIYFNYLWLKAGNSIYVTPGMKYEHRVNDHAGQEPSHYQKYHKRTPVGFYEEILRKLREL